MKLQRLSATSLIVAFLLGLLANCGKEKNQTIDVSKAKANMITLPNGLSYKVLKHGTQTTPKPGQTISAHYTGWLSDNGEKGKEFDSSFKRNAPIKFKVGMGEVIKGWDEALLSMGVGEQRLLIIPPELAYGDKGVPGAIPPKATLIFEVTLLSID